MGNNEVRIPSRRTLWGVVAAMAALALASIPLGSSPEGAAIPNYLTGASPAKTDYAERLGLSPDAVEFDLEAAIALHATGADLCAGPGQAIVPAEYARVVPVECERPLDSGFGVVMGLLSTGIAALGSIILLTSRNRWGLNILVAGVVLQTFGIAELYSERAIVLNPGSLPLGEVSLVVAGMGWVILGVVIGPRLLLTFPTGSPPSPRWRPVLWMSYLAAAILGLMLLLGPVHPYSINPIQVLSLQASTRIFDVGIQIWIFGAAIGSLVGLVVRFWRSTGEERFQLKWVASAAVVVILVNLVGASLGSEAMGGQEVTGPIQAFVSFVVLPAAILISIFKYRLYDIDRIISRTVAYTVVVLSLSVVYVAGAIWLPTSLTGEESPPLFVAGSTTVVAILFNPVRKRMLRWVDRRFNRTRYVSEKVVSQLSRRLRNRVDAGEVADLWEIAVSTSLQPTSIGVWVRD